MTTGKFRIRYEGSLVSMWIYFYYRTANGITEVKQEGSDQWRVGSIPQGALLIN